jgi:hypothetical protein
LTQFALIGVKEWDFWADDDPIATHHFLLESKHRGLQDILEQSQWDLARRDANVRRGVLDRQVKASRKRTDTELITVGDDFGLKGKVVRALEHAAVGRTGPS